MNGVYRLYCLVRLPNTDRFGVREERGIDFPTLAAAREEKAKFQGDFSTWKYYVRKVPKGARRRIGLDNQ